MEIGGGCQNAHFLELRKTPQDYKTDVSSEW